MKLGTVFVDKSLNRNIQKKIAQMVAEASHFANVPMLNWTFCDDF